MPNIDQITNRLQQIKENPGIYKELSAEEQADILLYILTLKPEKVGKQTKVLQGEPGRDGKDSLSKKQQTAILAGLVSKIKVKDGKDGKDAKVTTEMVDSIVATVISQIELPDLETVVTTAITADTHAVRDSLELIVDEDEKLKQTAVENLPTDLESIRKSISDSLQNVGGTSKPAVYRFIKAAIADGTIPAGGDGSSDWGDIGGNLTDQTDLQAALDAKAASLGADDNYVTDAEKIVIGNTTGTNTGDQDISGKQNVLAEGAFVDGDKTKLDTYSEANQTANNAKVSYVVAPYAHLIPSTTQNMGGSNGTVHYVNWDGTAINVDTGFTHSTGTNPSRIQVDADGRYEIKANVSVIQGGTARTTYMTGLRVNGTTANLRGRQRNYSRGSGYGDTSTGLCTEIDLTNGDYLEMSVTIDDSDGTYTSNMVNAESEFIIRKIA